MNELELKAHVLAMVRKCGQVSVFMVRAMLINHQGITKPFCEILDALEALEHENLVLCEFDSGARIYSVHPDALRQ